MRRVTMATRVVAVQERYANGERREKTRILDEFVAVTGFHRKLVLIWEASDRICGKRLKPLMPLSPRRTTRTSEACSRDPQRLANRVIIKSAARSRTASGHRLATQHPHGVRFGQCGTTRSDGRGDGQHPHWRSGAAFRYAPSRTGRTRLLAMSAATIDRAR
jgi:hypothetical protein